MYWRRSGSRTIKRDLCGVPGQEDRRLPRRVAAADDGDRITAAHQRLRLRGRVVDAHLLEVVRPGYGRPPVPRPGRDDHRVAVIALPSASRTWYRVSSRRWPWPPRAPRSARRTSGPGSAPARPVRRRRSRTGSRGSSRSGTMCRPGPRWLSRPAPPCPGLPTPRTRRRTGQAGPGPTTSRSRPPPWRTRHGQPDGRGQLGVGPGAQQPVAGEDHDRGLLGRHTELAGAAPRPTDRSPGPATGRAAGCGPRSRAAAWLSGEYLEPMMRRPAPRPIRIERRMR